MSNPGNGEPNYRVRFSTWPPTMAVGKLEETNIVLSKDNAQLNIQVVELEEHNSLLNEENQTLKRRLELLIDELEELREFHTTFSGAE